MHRAQDMLACGFDTLSYLTRHPLLFALARKFGAHAEALVLLQHGTNVLHRDDHGDTEVQVLCQMQKGRLCQAYRPASCCSCCA